MDITLPRSWSEISGRDLRFLFNVISLERYAPIQEKLIFALHAAKIRLIAAEPDGSAIVRFRKKTIRLTSSEILEISHALDFLDTFPDIPVRLPSISFRRALDPFFYDTPFSQWLAVETLWQTYVSSKQDECLFRIFDILYPKTRFRRMTPKVGKIRIPLIYWLTTLKNFFTKRYPNLFLPAGGVPVNPATLTEQVNAQIRALTKGDITKNNAILQTDTHSALAELDALAKETAEMKAMIKK